jgi:prepilin-type N-terminal cleavage/methylation domain-containing protein
MQIMARCRGFSLLEMSIVLVVIAGITAAAATMGGPMIESAKRTQTNNKLDTIEKALLAFRGVNNRLPCPADATVLPADANNVYGVEGDSATSCQSTSVYDGTSGVRTTTASPGPSANYKDAATNVVEGAVPVKTLNLPEDFMYDGWGHKFAYAVNYKLTAISAMLNESISDQAKIVVQDATGASRTNHLYSSTPSNLYTPDEAVYALVSYGMDGHGGYRRDGGRESNTGTVVAIDADELKNCHCGLNGVETTYAANYVQKELTPSFDNIVRYKVRAQMAGYDDLNTKRGGMVATLGTRINGITIGDHAGYSVVTGDINGDGIPDLIISADGANSGLGYVYVIFGSKYGFPYPLPLNALDGNNGFRLDGTIISAGLGSSLAIADINNDGYNDIIIGHSGNAGRVYVIYGGPTRKGGTAWSSNILLNTGGANILNGTDGFRLDGVSASDAVGTSIATADINGDGIPDIIIGAAGAPLSSFMGSVYVVYGGPTRKGGTAWGSATSLTSGGIINGIDGFRFDGTGVSQVIGFLVAAGDINADGYADLVMSSLSPNSVYVAFGKAQQMPQTTITTTNGSTSAIVGSFAGMYVGQTITSTNTAVNTTITACGGSNACTSTNVTLSANATATTTAPMNVTATAMNTSFINGINGLRFDGLINSFFGRALSVADFNNDGYADLIVGAPNYNGGVVYIIYGGVTPLGDPTKNWATSTYATSPGVYVVNLTGTGTGFINGTNGFRLDGVTVGDYAGAAVATSDINSDGYIDLVIGASQFSGNALGAGSVYVVYGGPTRKGGTAWGTNTSLSTGAANIINGTDGFRLDNNTATEGAGGVLSVGDINGDGALDIITAVPVKGGSAGTVYVAYGIPIGAAWPATSLFSTFK